MKLIDRIKNSKYMTLVPEKYRENENFLVFFYLLTQQFDINEENIRNFTSLINNDKVPMQFLQSLGAFNNYTYQHLAKTILTENFQCVCLTYGNRGVLKNQL